MKKLTLALSLGLGFCSFSTGMSAVADFGSPSSAQVSVPEIGSGIGFLDQQKEKLIGEKVYRQVQKQFPLVNEPWLQDQFMSIFSRILSQTQLGRPIALVVIKDPQINAFAVPGGLFALNTGLITSSKNMDEVAGVMAHEIAHVTQRHYSRSKEAFKGQGLLALAGILVGAVIASQSDRDVGGAVMMGTQAAFFDRQLSYSRNQEREADRIGMQFMHGSGFNPHSMADFFETMHRQTATISYFPDFWLTHPQTSERMSEARLRANQFPEIKNQKEFDQSEFEVIKWHTAVVSQQISELRLKTIARKGNFAGILALSEFYMRQGDYKQAQSMMNQAKEIQPEHNLLNLIQTDIYLGQGRLDDALNTILPKQRIMPENRALSYKLAEVYLRKKQPKDAEGLVNRFLMNNGRDVLGWQLLQQASSLDKENPMQTVNVLRYRAEAEYWNGLEEQAIKSLLHAQRLAKENISMSSIISTRLKAMQAERQLKI